MDVIGADKITEKIRIASKMLTEAGVPSADQKFYVDPERGIFRLFSDGRMELMEIED